MSRHMTSAGADSAATSGVITLAGTDGDGVGDVLQASDVVDRLIWRHP